MDIFARIFDSNYGVGCPSIRKIERRKKTIKECAEAGFEGNAVISKGLNWSETLTELERLEDIIEAIQINKIEAEMEVPPPITFLEKKLSAYNKTKEKRIKLSDMILNIKKSETEIKSTEGYIKDNELIFKKAMGKECPLCGKLLKNQK